MFFPRVHVLSGAIAADGTKTEQGVVSLEHARMLGETVEEIPSGTRTVHRHSVDLHRVFSIRAVAWSGLVRLEPRVGDRSVIAKDVVRQLVGLYVEVSTLMTSKMRQ